MTVYISGSITHLPSEDWKIYEKIGKVVKDFGLIPYVPHMQTPKKVGASIHDIREHQDENIASDIFQTDISEVEKASLIIAEVSNPSTGSGIEIGIALKLKTPIICLARKDAKVTALIIGAIKDGLIKSIIYENKEDALSKLKNMLENDFHELK